MTGLEALKRVRDNLSWYCSQENLNDFVVIEKALKDYERRLALAKEYKDVNNVAKRLKALEIIKEKCVVSFAKKDNADDFGKTRYTTDNYNEVISDEEYELLKEVLL